MIDKIKILFIRRKFIYLFYIVLSLSPYLWHSNLSHTLFAGYGDFLSPIQANYPFIQRFFVYNQQLFGGVDFTFLTAHIFFFQGFYWLFHEVGFSSAFITILMLSTMILISQLSMFFLAVYAMRIRLKIIDEKCYVYAFFVGVMYGFSPYMVGILQPGHILQLFSYMMFPFLLLSMDKLLTRKSGVLDSFIQISIVLFISSPAFANIGMLYVTFFIICLYCFGFMFFEHPNIYESLHRIAVIFIAAICSNIWWITPYIFTFKDAMTLNNKSLDINSAIDSAVNHATISNIFLGRAENTLFNGFSHTLYTNECILVIFYTLCVLVFTLILSKNKGNRFIHILLYLLIVGALISKGTQAPFSFIFDWMYLHIPGFQIFRRPVSKFYWFFLLLFYILSVLGGLYLHLLTKKTYIKTLLISFFTISCMYFVFSFIKTPLLKPFNVPSYYLDAGKYFDRTNAVRILILPGFYGTYPSYDKSVSNYYGDDFINSIWNHGVLVPDSTGYSINTPTKFKVSELMTYINSHKNICSLTKQLGISHIVVRQDINPSSLKEADENFLIKRLQTNDSILSFKEFKSKINKGFTIFDMKPDCRSQSIVASNADFTFEVQNPTTISIVIKQGIIKDTFVQILLNESMNWNLYLLPSSGTFNPLLALINGYPQMQKSVLEEKYVNRWTINDKIVKSQAKTLGYKQNANGNYSYRFVAFYKIQAYLYLGFILFFLIIVIVLLLKVKSYGERRNKKFHK